MCHGDVEVRLDLGMKIKCSFMIMINEFGNNKILIFMLIKLIG